MAGHAKNVEEEWTRSIDHLRDMAHQNEESLMRNKRLTSVLSVPNRELIDGIEHVVPALDERRASWAKDQEFQRRLLDERCCRIDQSREDVVHFQDIGMNWTQSLASHIKDTYETCSVFVTLLWRTGNIAPRSKQNIDAVRHRATFM